MAAEAKTEKRKVNEKDALDAAGNPVSDYTEAVSARITHLATKASTSRSFAHIPAPIDRAFAIEGWLNKAGHAVNSATNGPNADNDVQSALDAFTANVDEGGWTNRSGGNEVNLAAIQAAFAQMRGADVERVKELWPTFTDEQKAGIRANPQVRLLVQEAKTAKLRALAGTAAATDSLPAL
jgi:hypothetical protein